MESPAPLQPAVDWAAFTSTRSEVLVRLLVPVYVHSFIAHLVTFSSSRAANQVSGLTDRHSHLNALVLCEYPLANPTLDDIQNDQ
jgi:hypothetical protein